jgi:hypothetical protein
MRAPLLLVLAALYIGGCCAVMPAWPGCPPGASYGNIQRGLQVGLGAGPDLSTTAFMLGPFVNSPLGPVRGEVALEYGFGNEDGYEPPQELQSGTSSLLGGGGEALDKYRVFQTYLHLKYPFRLGSSWDASFYPLVGPRYYRFAYADCDSDVQECVFPAGTVDVGAGIEYGPFSVDVFTGVFGDVPDASIRARYAYPLGGR